ncbi:translocator protein-like [Glandiceps talaboti]
MSDWLPTAGAIILPNIGGILGGFITKNEISTWYKTLEKPKWRPPNWLFGPMWTSLYCSMGYASYLVWRDGGGFEGAMLPLTAYGSSLALNWAWTPIFFGAHKIGWAAVEIIIYWANVAGCMYLFHPINKTATYLLAPLLGWVTLASTLNIWIWKNNKDKQD